VKYCDFEVTEAVWREGEIRRRN